MRTTDGYGRQGLPVLANMLADALMVGTRATAHPAAGGVPRSAVAPDRLALRVRGGRLLRAGLAGLDRWLHRQTMRRWESYLAQSQNVYELEERMRRLERDGGPFSGHGLL